MEPLSEHGFVAGHDELIARSRFGNAAAHGERVAGAGTSDVRHGGPHGALVSVGAADPPAEKEQLGEEFLPHFLAAVGEGIIRHGVISSEARSGCAYRRL